MDNEVVTVNTYDGTMESLELMAKLLKLKSGDYNFDIETKCIAIFKTGWVLQPGDCYYSNRRPEKFKAIG